MHDSPTGEMQRSEFVKIYRELFPNGDATTFSNYIFNIIDQELWGPYACKIGSKGMYNFDVGSCCFNKNRKESHLCQS